jgi:hypothetical protein
MAKGNKGNYRARHLGTQMNRPRPKPKTDDAPFMQRQYDVRSDAFSILWADYYIFVDGPLPYCRMNPRPKYNTEHIW